MKIKINNADADITLDDEKTIGDVVAGITDWFSATGWTIGTLELDGKAIGASKISEAFVQNIDSVDCMNVSASSQSEICVEALSATCDAIALKKDLIDWEKSDAASFLNTFEKEAYNLAISAFSDEGAKKLLEAEYKTRKKELLNPIGEFLALEAEVKNIVARLSDLALDIQTGKDSKAAQTVNIFSKLVAKILKLIPLLRFSGLEFEKLNLGEDFFEELCSALKEFLSAYEAQDTVLSGDLAEYEVAPRLNDLYNAVKEKTEMFNHSRAI
jgi:hypothetical protein